MAEGAAPPINSAITSGAAFGNSGGMGAGSGGGEGSGLEFEGELFHGGFLKAQALFPSISSYDGLQLQMMALSNLGLSRIFGDGAQGLWRILTKGLDMSGFWGWGEGDGGGDGDFGGGGDYGGDFGGGDYSGGDFSGGDFGGEGSPFSLFQGMPDMGGGTDVPMSMLGAFSPEATPGMGEMGISMSSGASVEM